MPRVYVGVHTEEGVAAWRFFIKRTLFGLMYSPELFDQLSAADLYRSFMDQGAVYAAKYRLHSGFYTWGEET